MATKYVYSGAGGANNGTSWTDAWLTLAQVSGAGAGDLILVASDHSESQSTAQTIAFPGTLASPNRVESASRSDDTYAAGASATNSVGGGGIAWLFTGSFWMRGGTFIASGAAVMRLGGAGSFNGNQTYKDCTFRNTGNNSGRYIQFGVSGASVSQRILARDCHFKFANAGQGFQVDAGDIRLESCDFESGSTALTTLFNGNFGPTGGRNQYLTVAGCDFANAGSAVDLMIATGTVGVVRVYFSNCALPASWTGTPWSAAPTTAGASVELHNCNSGDVNYAVYREDNLGVLTHETTIVRSGARTDGTTNVTWKVVTTASAKFNVSPFELPAIRIWCETVGSVTVKIPFVHNDATDATTAELGMDIWYAGTSNKPLYLLATTEENARSGYASHADATSDDNWGSTGFANENEQRMSLTFTTAEKGWVIIVPKVYEASKTVYIDPDPQIS